MDWIGQGGVLGLLEEAGGVGGDHLGLGWFYIIQWRGGGNVGLGSVRHNWLIWWVGLFRSRRRGRRIQY